MRNHLQPFVEGPPVSLLLRRLLPFWEPCRSLPFRLRLIKVYTIAYDKSKLTKAVLMSLE
jgi:hypothetical protein